MLREHRVARRTGNAATIRALERRIATIRHALRSNEALTRQRALVALAAENKPKIWGALRNKSNSSSLLPPMALVDYCRALVGGELDDAPPGAPVERPPAWLHAIHQDGGHPHVFSAHAVPLKVRCVNRIRECAAYNKALDWWLRLFW